MDKVDLSILGCYSIYVDGEKIAKVPFGDLEHFVNCILHCKSVCSISFDDEKVK